MKITHTIFHQNCYFLLHTNFYMEFRDIQIRIYARKRDRQTKYGHNKIVFLYTEKFNLWKKEMVYVNYLI